MPGGRRDGAGRPPKGRYGVRSRSLTIRMSELVYNELRILKSRGLSSGDIIEQLIHNEYRKK